METDKEGPANSKEIQEFEFGLAGQFSRAAGWGRIIRGEGSPERGVSLWNN
jgi:hypothetical protein